MRGNIVKILLAVAILSIMATAVSAGSYDRYAARNYARAYAENPNPEYRDFTNSGGDCTNFVSQALLAGGWTEIGKYSYTSSYAWYYDWGYRGGYS